MTTRQGLRASGVSIVNVCGRDFVVICPKVSQREGESEEASITWGGSSKVV